MTANILSTLGALLIVAITYAAIFWRAAFGPNPPEPAAHPDAVDIARDASTPDLPSDRDLEEWLGKPSVIPPHERREAP